MASNKNKKLNPEQLDLIDKILDEWIKIALDTSPCDKQKAEDAIKFTYKCAALEPPKDILWFDNPASAITWMIASQPKQYDRSWLVYDDLWYYLTKGVDINIDTLVTSIFKETIEYHFLSARTPLLIHGEIFNALLGIIADSYGYNYGYVIRHTDFFFTQRNPNGVFEIDKLAFYSYFNTMGVDISILSGWLETAKYCGWWWSCEKFVIAIPKPFAINFDGQVRLHAEGIPAVSYKDFNIYAYHGVRIPEKYGKIHPSQWQEKWLLEEKNAELRQVLVQGIGYGKI
jgi:hypothetical protein